MPTRIVGEDVEKRKTRLREYYLSNRDKIRANSRLWHANNKDRRDAQLRFKLYGLTVDAYNNLLSKQDGMCAICQEVMTVPEVDHDHKDNKVRGLLCGRCNKGLGLFLDSTDHLLSAVEYLEGV